MLWPEHASFVRYGRQLPNRFPLQLDRAHSSHPNACLLVTRCTRYPSIGTASTRVLCREGVALSAWSRARSRAASRWRVLWAEHWRKKASTWTACWVRYKHRVLDTHGWLRDFHRRRIMRPRQRRSLAHHRRRRRRVRTRCPYRCRCVPRPPLEVVGKALPRRPSHRHLLIDLRSSSSGWPTFGCVHPSTTHAARCAIHHATTRCFVRERRL